MRYALDSAGWRLTADAHGDVGGETEADAATANEDPANLIPPRDPNLPTLEGLNLVGFDNSFDASLQELR